MRFLAVFLLALATYILFVGSVSPYDLATGIVVSIVAACIFGRVLVKDSTKLRPSKLAHLVKYLVSFIAIEIRAHSQMIKIILSKDVRKAIRPGIVKILYDLHSDYAVTMLANSITNTPGTLVVDVDENEHALYVHWIRVKTTDPEKAREIVSKIFEDYARKVFD